VLNLVRLTPGTIGYLELSYAMGNGVPVAAIRNQAGEFVLPTPDAAATAIAAFEGDLENDMRTPIVAPPASAKKAYPISGFTFLLIRKVGGIKDEEAAVRDFVAYAISTGQDSAERLSFAKLPPSVQQKAQALLAQLTANVQPTK
jgi:phosphate transport system substrate-binding protein